MDGVTVEGIKAVHGPIAIKILGRMVRQKPGPGERVGLGATGFRINVGGKTLVNLGDTLLQEEWAGLRQGVLMLPIGGLGGTCGRWISPERWRR